MLLKSKEQIVWAAQEAALQAMKSHSSVGWHMNQNSVMGQLTELIALAVAAGVKEALDGMYTDQQFEQDTGLNS